LPEAHAIYWAALGLKKAEENPTKVKGDDLIILRRVIYQSLLLSFHRGRLVTNPFAGAFEFGPNLAIIRKVNFAYEQAAEEDKANRDHILKAHRNFLRDAVYFLYEYNRLGDAAEWYRYLATKYPDKPVLTGDTNSLPSRMTVDQYAVARVQEDVSESGGHDRTQGVIEGLLVNSYRSMALNEDEAAAGFRLLAQKVWEAYQRGIPKERLAAIGLRPFAEIDREIRSRMLDPRDGEPFEVRAVLRTKLGEPPEASPPPAATNAPPARTPAP
jgi:nuclear transport factor 2 (NTF2) superfamily protein